MLSPKMQKTVRVNDAQILMLSERAHYDHSLAGYLHKKTADSAKWQLRWFILYQNLLFYYESESYSRPSGIVLLEGCYCDRLITTRGKESEKQYCFAISYRRENIRQYELKAKTESDCKIWIEAIREASFNKLLLQREELEQKHLHLLQIVESEKIAKWQYTQQCEELTSEIKKLRSELCTIKKELRPRSAAYTLENSGKGSRTLQYDSVGAHPFLNITKESNIQEQTGTSSVPESSFNDMEKIKKVQSFFRGWLCRRRWKQIVDQYIKSPHAESMRKRNSLVFQMVEAEEEYTKQMEILVSCFLRPFKMAASSKKPPCSHEDVNSIFLNSETVLFLHQIFLKGLTSRMESWPTLVLGDLFDMLLPMLSIYQEYVRNHHYSLQVLTECKQSSPSFAAFLTRLENKPTCQGRSLETFLTYPMHQVPKYIITLHEVLAHTPHDHVERKSLQNARQQLEDLSRQMHDEVSETENLRKNLAVERMIIEGCDILLDVNQVFVRQGTLIQISDKPRGVRSRLSAAFKSTTDKVAMKQCFLFSNHLILTTRQSDDHGRLNLVPNIGKIPLSDAILIEDPCDQNLVDDDEVSICSMSSGISDSSRSGSGNGSSNGFGSRDFKIILDMKSGSPISIHLLTPSMQEKAAWISDISQCMDNVHFNDSLHGSLSDTSSVTMPQSIRNDPKLFKDDVDIRFSRTLNSCKLPHIRYATPERLLQRLTDLRFLSIDFLNTFLLTYRVFTDGVTVLEALKKVFYDSEPSESQLTCGSLISLDRLKTISESQLQFDDRRRSSASPRRTSGASSVSGYGSEVSDSREARNFNYFESPLGLQPANTKGLWRSGYSKLEEEQAVDFISEVPPVVKRSPTESLSSSKFSKNTKNFVTTEFEDGSHLKIPKVITGSTSSETLIALSAPSSPSNISSITLVESTGSESVLDPSPQDIFNQQQSNQISIAEESKKSINDSKNGSSDNQQRETLKSPNFSPRSKSSKFLRNAQDPEKVDGTWTDEDITNEPCRHLNQSFHDQTRSASIASTPPSTAVRAGSLSTIVGHYLTGRKSFQEESNLGRQLGRAGVVITSFRQSHRRSSTSSAAAAFAVATSASSNPPDKITTQNADGNNQCRSCNDKTKRKEPVSTAATMRVLNVLRHWVSKHAQDFELNLQLKYLTIEFLNDIVGSSNLLPAEQKAASQLLRLICKEETENSKIDLEKLLNPPLNRSQENIETLSALEIAEQMTYLDHKIFLTITSEEFLSQAWMKTDKATRAPHIILMTKRFNEISQLIVSEIVRRSNMLSRVAAIEKWAAVADICRVLHNYNGVLQICAAFTNSSVYRLKKTWEKVSKTTKQTIDKLQNIVSSDGRFRNLRDALHRCDPPCIPYLGLYLTDLSFIEEGTPNFTEDGLLNFSKMRMIAHVIREIRHFQQTPYKIEIITKVTNYLLDTTLLLDEEELYRTSLEIEPRASRLSSAAFISIPPNISQSLKKEH